ncbi:MAG: C40 family peptidase [Leeuwenhoekiella sp.]
MLLLILTGCGGTKKRTSAINRATPVINRNTNSGNLATEIAKNALRYEGTRYKYGGTTKKGMDCSGLIYTAFAQAGSSLPRVSSAMAQEGKSIKLKNVAVGDLLFFHTGKSRRKINHVGLVVDLPPGQILFVHATTSGGVIVSSLNEGYWNNAFAQARRVL